VALATIYKKIPKLSGEKEPPDRGGGEQQEAAEGDRGQDPEGALQLPGEHTRGRDCHSGEDNYFLYFTLGLKGLTDGTATKRSIT
jgi:hypothetical protein